MANSHQSHQPTIGAGITMDMAFAIAESRTLLFNVEDDLIALMNAKTVQARDTAMENYRQSMGDLNAQGAHLANAIGAGQR